MSVETVYEMLKKIRYDATAIQAKITDALNALNDLDLPDESRTKCPHCELKLRGPNTLSEHVYTSHDGPLPAHWVSADEKVEA